MQNDGVKCIAKEDELTYQMLRHGADSLDDYLIDISSVCLGPYELHFGQYSVAASAVMLGMAKEAEMMYCGQPHSLAPTLECYDRRTRESSTASTAGKKIDKEGPASRNGHGGDGDGDGITADGEANNTTGGGISDVLDSEYKEKIEGGEKSKIKKEDLFEKLWGWERLLPLSNSVKWADYRSYLEEFYKGNASEFVAGALANQNPEDSQIANNSYMGAALAKSCHKMEEELLSVWKTRVKRSMNDTLPVSTIIQSSLIKELLSFSATGSELLAPSDVAFVVHKLVQILITSARFRFTVLHSTLPFYSSCIIAYLDG
ncbi:uncharacterized protein [Lolium perenne]|uniref:uncharacterized protein n=1 Tax=Lolium perenne TaxID=4522 RepID=UPI003A9A652F